MKFNYLIIALFLFTTTSRVFASNDCDEVEIPTFNILPQNDSIYANSVFVITYNSFYLPIKDQISGDSFFLENEKGKRIKLEIVEHIKITRNMRQIVLKTCGRFKTNKEYHFRFEPFDLPKDRQDRLSKLLSRHHWFIKNERDEIPPEFTGEVQWKYRNFFDSSSGGHGFSLHVKNKDNSTIKGRLIVEISDSTGKKMFQSIRGTSFWIFDQGSLSTFHFKFNREYQFQLRLMDYSGNFSEPIIVTVKTGKWKKEEDIIIEIER